MGYIAFCNMLMFDCMRYLESTSIDIHVEPILPVTFQIDFFRVPR